MQPIIAILAILIFLVVLPIYLVWMMMVRAWQEKMIAEGKGAMYVKIAASGRGGTYHHLSCGKCRSRTVISVNDARNQGYVPCSICGGSPKFVLNADLV